MKSTENKSSTSKESAERKFTRGHEILMAGLIGSGMSYRDIFHLEMSLATEKEAMDLALWIRDKLDEQNDQFPTPEEILRQARRNRRYSEETGEDNSQRGAG